MKVRNVPACVYVIIVTTAGEETYFKIGRSTCIQERIGAVQTGCPLPIERVLLLPLVENYISCAMEAALHKRFAKFHTHGEWFLFNLTNPSHKAEFHLGCDEVIRTFLTEWRWEMHSVADAKILGKSAQKEQIRKNATLNLRIDSAIEADKRRRVSLGNCSGFWR